VPPLPFWRRPPQSNCPPGIVLNPDHGSQLELRQHQAGISTLTPRRLAPPLPSLPAILHKSCQNSVPSYSKAPRGLSVLPRVDGILTTNAISPSPSPRQRSTRYAIRAGRNLPDKEFRYLRTVIVTAAVYWGFSSKLRACALTLPFNLPAPGRRQTLYIVLRLRRVLCLY
jgi:hypothetical protein